MDIVVVIKLREEKLKINFLMLTKIAAKFLFWSYIFVVDLRVSE